MTLMEKLLDRLRSCENIRYHNGYYKSSYFDTNEKYIEMLKEKIRELILND